jgi:hypothetical protein
MPEDATRGFPVVFAVVFLASRFAARSFSLLPSLVLVSIGIEGDGGGTGFSSSVRFLLASSRYDDAFEKEATDETDSGLEVYEAELATRSGSGFLTGSGPNWMLMISSLNFISLFLASEATNSGGIVRSLPWTPRPLTPLPNPASRLLMSETAFFTSVAVMSTEISLITTLLPELL